MGTKRRLIGLRRALLGGLGLGLLLALAPACGGVGATCSRSSQCEGDGQCIKGACSLRSCSVDDECGGGSECAQITGFSLCALPCEGTDGCPGDQRCTELSDGGGRYCL